MEDDVNGIDNAIYRISGKYTYVREWRYSVDTQQVVCTTDALVLLYTRTVWFLGFLSLRTRIIKESKGRAFAGSPAVEEQRTSPLTRRLTNISYLFSPF